MRVKLSACSRLGHPEQWWKFSSKSNPFQSFPFLIIFAPFLLIPISSLVFIYPLKRLFLGFILFNSHSMTPNVVPTSRSILQRFHCTSLVERKKLRSKETLTTSCNILELSSKHQMKLTLAHLKWSNITTRILEFRSISENQDSKLHHLIPEAYSPHYNFRRQRTYNVPAAKTKRFANSFFVKCAAVTNSSLRWMRTPFNRTLSHYIYNCILVACK